jgi:hypothetical protein
MRWWVSGLTGIERLAATRSGRYSHGRGGFLGCLRVQQYSLDLASGPWVSTGRGSMVSTLGAGRGCSRGGRAQAGFAGGGRRSAASRSHASCGVDRVLACVRDSRTRWSGQWNRMLVLYCECVAVEERLRAAAVLTSCFIDWPMCCCSRLGASCQILR